MFLAIDRVSKVMFAEVHEPEASSLVVCQLRTFFKIAACLRMCIHSNVRG